MTEEALSAPDNANSVTGRGERWQSRPRVVVVPLLGLFLSGLVVLGLLLGLGKWAGGQRQAEMRSLHERLPAYTDASLTRTYENWDNLVVYWQGESVLPRIVSEFTSEHPIGAVTTFYKERLTAEGWEEYHEPWSLYPAYRRGPYRIAILFQRPFAQDWLPADNYEAHLWSLPLLEETLGHDTTANGDNVWPPKPGAWSKQ